MQFWSLKTPESALTPYEIVRQLQLKLVDLRAQDQIPDTVLFLEHEPVITRGRGLQFTGKQQPRNMPLGPLPPSVSFAESERGGDLTYHGPGQLVIYPICKLDGQGFAPDHDISAFLRKVESAVMVELDERLQSIGAKCEGVENATGVWVRPEGGSSEDRKKIASMGIAVRKWVSYHGIALNCVNDLRAFQWISPCGFSPEVMTRLTDWVSLDVTSWRADLEVALARRMVGGSARVESKILSEIFPC